MSEEMQFETNQAEAEEAKTTEPEMPVPDFTGLTFGKPKTKDLPTPKTLAETALTPEEKQQVTDFAKTIDIANVQGVIEYGSGVQKQMAGFSDTVLDNIQTKDLGEIGGMLTDVMLDLKDFNPDKKKGGFLGLFKKPGRKIEELKAGYDKASINVVKVSDALQLHQVKLMKDISVLDQMYEANLTYYKQLSMYIAAGKEKLKSVKASDLPAMQAKAKASGSTEDAQAVKDLQEQITRFEKKIYDLELTREVALQTAPQIRTIQNNDTIMVEKIHSTIVNTIPLWKNQMVLALGLNDSLQASRAENAVDETTNRLLRQNAAKLKQSTIETAKASERGIVDLETLKQTNQSLISTLDEVAKIQADGRQKREAAEVELQKMEEEMKQKLLTMSQNQPGNRQM